MKYDEINGHESKSALRVLKADFFLSFLKLDMLKKKKMKYYNHYI